MIMIEKPLVAAFSLLKNGAGVGSDADDDLARVQSMQW